MRYAVKAFPVKVEGDDVYVQVPTAPRARREHRPAPPSRAPSKKRGGRGDHVWSSSLSDHGRHRRVDPAEHREATHSRSSNSFFGEQQTGAVELFAQRHESDTSPALERLLSRPAFPRRLPPRGEQYAFEVDLDSCTGCKACVTACHNLNGLDEDEAWRKVGLLPAAAARPR